MGYNLELERPIGGVEIDLEILVSEVRRHALVTALAASQHEVGRLAAVRLARLAYLGDREEFDRVVNGLDSVLF